MEQWQPGRKGCQEGVNLDVLCREGARKCPSGAVRERPPETLVRAHQGHSGGSQRSWAGEGPESGHRKMDED